MQEGIPQGQNQDKRQEGSGAQREALPLTKERLEEIFKTEGPQVKQLMLLRYELQELERAEAAKSPEEMFDIYMQTARTLSELGPIAEARKHLEELTNFAYNLGDEKRLREAEAAIDALPSVH